MKFYTSSFESFGDHTNAVAISPTPPVSFEGRHIPAIAPSPDVYRKSKTNPKAAYAEFIAQLSDVDWEEVQSEFPEEGAIFLGFAEPGKFDLRRVVAKWVEHHTGEKPQEIARR